jgi:hypothetical protein
LHIRVRPKIYKGNNYDHIIGSIMSDMIADQTNPLIKAICDEVNAKKTK